MRCLRLCGISVRFQTLFPSTRQVAHALLTRPPLTHFPKETRPFDLNVLCTPPAFILSQDQTLVLFLSYLLLTKGSFNKIEFYLFALYLFKEFSWFAQIVQFVRCCSIFKVLPVRSLADSFNIIPHEDPFVNTFFSFFSLSFLRFLQISLSKMYILHKN